MQQDSGLLASCPTPLTNNKNILLAHGGGGLLTNQLIENLFVKAFDNEILNQRNDGAILKINDQRLAFTTDSYVVDPLFFPGGDIGTLAVNGTINDLAMCGAKPLWISLALIIEEGLSMDVLSRIVMSLKKQALETKVQIVTGDTKVVNRGKGDKIYINTAGIGVLEHHLEISPSNIRSKDRIIINGDIGRHALAIMQSREGLQFETQITSDCAPVAELVEKLISENIEIHCMRDLTRGGLAGALLELSHSSGMQFNLHEEKIEIKEEVHGASEILGLDPLYMANEGRFVCFVSENEVDRAMNIFNSHSSSSNASVIGHVGGLDKGKVSLTNSFGTSRNLQMISGEQLPRIC